MESSNTIVRRQMFCGKDLPGFFERYAPLYAELVQRHGAEKVYAVYDYFFAYLSNLHWGQYFVFGKLCPRREYGPLTLWVLECIYESDLFSQFAWRWGKDAEGKDELRVYCVEPTKEQRQMWSYFLRPDGRYSLIDWFGRLRQDPKALPEVNPEWLMLSSGSSEPEDNSEELGVRSEE